MKKIKFRPDLIASILDGSRTITWRLFDDKNLSKGDELILVNANTLDAFAKVIIVSVKKTKLGSLSEVEMKGHNYSSKEQMYERFSKLYNKKVDGNCELKIVEFKLI